MMILLFVYFYFMIDFIAPLVLRLFVLSFLSFQNIILCIFWTSFLGIFNTFYSHSWILYYPLYFIFNAKIRKISSLDFRIQIRRKKEKNSFCESGQCKFNWCLFLYDFYQTNHKIRFSLFWIKACGRSIIKYKYHRLYIIHCILSCDLSVCVWERERPKLVAHVWGRRGKSEQQQQ